MPPLISHGFPLVSSGFPSLPIICQPISTDLQFILHGFPMVSHGFPLVCHGLPLIPSVLHGLPLLSHGLPWIFNGLPLIPYGFPHISPWISICFPSAITKPSLLGIRVPRMTRSLIICMDNCGIPLVCSIIFFVREGDSPSERSINSASSSYDSGGTESLYDCVFWCN